MYRRTFVQTAALSLLTTQALAESGCRVHAREPDVPLTGGALLHRFSVSGEDSADFSVVVFETKRCTLRVLDQPDSGSAKTLGQVMREQNGIAGVNAGFFTPTFEPLGLVIADGKRAGSWMRSTLLGGVVLVKNGKLTLLWRDEMGTADGVSQLVQAGPRLVNNGEPVTGLDAAKERARTFIATDNAGRWAIGLCEYTSLAGLAAMLSTKGLIPGMTIHRALNFDGGKSSGLWCRRADGEEIYEREIATVRNFVGVFPR
jgi:hypothetical protein